MVRGEVSDPWREKPLSRLLTNYLFGDDLDEWFQIPGGKNPLADLVDDIHILQEKEFQIPGGKNPLADFVEQNGWTGVGIQVSDPWREKPLSRHGRNVFR